MPPGVKCATKDAVWFAVLIRIATARADAMNVEITSVFRSKIAAFRTRNARDGSDVTRSQPNHTVSVVPGIDFVAPSPGQFDEIRGHASYSVQ